MQDGGERESPHPLGYPDISSQYWCSLDFYGEPSVAFKDKATPRVILTFLFFFNHLKDATLICEL